jgi:hypothetical protein
MLPNAFIDKPEMPTDAEAALQSGLPRRVIKIIDTAPRYPEGTGVRLEVRGPRDVAIVKKLAVVKLEH